MRPVHSRWSRFGPTSTSWPRMATAGAVAPPIVS